jgi:hypothetical protein
MEALSKGARIMGLWKPLIQSLFTRYYEWLHFKLKSFGIQRLNSILNQQIETE